MIELIPDLSGVSRTAAIAIFNENCINNSDKTKNSSSGFVDNAEEDMKLSKYLDKALEVCLHHKLTEKLGLTLKDVLEMDNWTFTKIRKALETISPKEDAIIANLQNQLKGKK